MRSASDALVGCLVQGCPCKTAHSPHTAEACARPQPPARLSGSSLGAESDKYSTRGAAGGALPSREGPPRSGRLQARATGRRRRQDLCAGRQCDRLAGCPRTGQILPLRPLSGREKAVATLRTNRPIRQFGAQVSLHFCAVLPRLTTSIWTNFLPLGQKVLPLNKLVQGQLNLSKSSLLRGKRFVQNAPGAIVFAQNAAVRRTPARRKGCFGILCH